MHSRIKTIRTKITVLAWVLLFAIVCVLLKALTIYFDFEPLPYSFILSSMISSNIFLFGFMLNGVLMDYKEAEKIPDEIAVSVEASFDQCFTTYKRTKNDYCLDYIQSLLEFIRMLDDWFHKKIHTRDIMYKLNGFNEHILKTEVLTQATFIGRLKQEISNLRRLTLRAYSIRERVFLGSAHTIIRFTTLFILFNLILTKYNTEFEAMLYVFGFSSIFIFLVKLIHDLDNPFDYYSQNHKYRDAVSLESLHDLNIRITQEMELLKK